MKYLLGSEKDFFDFVDSIKKEDKVGIITHTDLDGIASAIFLEKILESKGVKVEKILFVYYGFEMFKKPFIDLKKHEINKLFLTDMYADGSDIEGFEKLRKNFDTFLVDHHPIRPELKNTDNIIKTESADCSTLVLYNLAEKVCDMKSWDWLVCATMIAEFSFNSPENLKFIQERYPKITKKNIFISEPKETSDKLNSTSVYYKDRDGLMKVYNLVKKKDFKEIESIHKIVDKEIQRAVRKYDQEAEFYPEKNLYFAYFKVAFPIASTVSTILSKQDYDKIYIFTTDVEKDMVKFSARNQSGRENLNLLLRKGIQGLKEADAGGHEKAAAGSIRREDLNKFKENILR